MDDTRGNAALQLVFSGECLDGHDPQVVRRAVAGALKLDAKRAARLFSGKRVVLRRNVDAIAAQRQVERFAQLGAVLRTEPSKPRRQRAAPARTRDRPVAPFRAPRRRPPAWVRTGLGLGLGLVLALGLGLGLSALWGEVDAPGAASWEVANAPFSPAPAPAAADGSATTAPADSEIPRDMTAEAVNEYKLRDLAAPRHKAFAISSRGAHAWHAGAASDNDARERALADCMRAQPPSEDGCRVVDADGKWEE